MGEYAELSFLEVVNSFSEGLSDLFAPISEFNRQRKIKKSANAILNLVIAEVSKKNISKLVREDILKNMPKGIWNIETISLVEKQMHLFFDEEFVNLLSANLIHLKLSDKEKGLFLMNYLTLALKNSVNMIRFSRKMIGRSSLKEKDLLNLKLGREFVATLNFMEEATINTIKEMRSIFPKFMKKLKKYWTAYTLLTLRILDISFTFEKNKKLADKKLDNLHYELIKAKNYI